MKIEDGTGTGKFAAVTTDNRLQVDAKTSSELHEVSYAEGQVFMLSTGSFINITTTGTETGIFYVKNTSSTKFLIINAIRTCGNQIQKVTFYKNPTGGTLISAATAGQSTNFNLSSSNTSDCTIYKGANGSTVSGGTWFGQHINNVGHSTFHTSDALILGKNASFAITFELASAGDVCVAVEAYFSAT